MADSPAIPQPPELSAAAIDLLLEETPSSALLDWLGEQTFWHGVMRGFQHSTKSLRMAPVRKRLKEALHHHPQTAQALAIEWKLNYQNLIDAITPISDKKLLKLLPELQEKFDQKSLRLALLLEGRESVLEQHIAVPKQKTTPPKAVSKKRNTTKVAELVQTITQLQAKIQEQKEALESSAENLRQTQQTFKQEITCFHQQQQHTLSREREWARELKHETARAAKAEQLLEETTRVANRNERRLKKLQQEQEATDLEIKRLRRQMRQQQQIAEDLRKQLAGLQPQISNEAKILSDDVPARVSPKKAAPKSKALTTPADQQFLFDVAGNHFQISARQLAQAVERNDEDLVFSLTQALFTLRDINPAGHKMFLERVRAFDRYSTRVLTGDTTRVLVDASNVARFEKNKYGKGILENLLALRDELRSRSYFPIILIADASLPHYIDQPQEFKKLVHAGIIQITNKGEEADEYLTRLAQQTGAFVVTNDVNFHLKIAPNFDPLRIGFTINQGAVYLHEF